MPGRPTCLTVVGRKTLPKKLEAPAEEMTVEPEQPANEKKKKKKEKGKADRRTTSSSGTQSFSFTGGREGRKYSRT